MAHPVDENDPIFARLTPPHPTPPHPNPARPPTDLPRAKKHIHNVLGNECDSALGLTGWDGAVLAQETSGQDHPLLALQWHEIQHAVGVRKSDILSIVTIR
jgi:hypothetical protein